MTGIFTFNSSNQIPPKIPPAIELLIAAGGGGGGYEYAGTVGGAGGGGGGYEFTSSQPVTLGAIYTLTIGAAGAAATQGSNTTITNGLTKTMYGGGLGGNAQASAGGNGGSGGGGGSCYFCGPAGGGVGVYPGSTYVNAPRQGYDGSGGGGGGSRYSGGGGGATAAGTISNGGTGGTSSISGSSTVYAGGGNGGAGSHGGGAFTNGAGGGYGAGWGGSPTAGYSGVIIIAYPLLYPVITSIGGGLTYTYSAGGTRAGYRVYTFTGGTGNISWS